VECARENAGDFIDCKSIHDLTGCFCVSVREGERGGEGG
jgi:hypothetical protein